MVQLKACGKETGGVTADHCLFDGFRITQEIHPSVFFFKVILDGLNFKTFFN